MVLFSREEALLPTMFEINFTLTAANHIRTYRKFEQQIILDAVEEQLIYEPII